MAVFESKKSSNDIIVNDTMSDDEVVGSVVPPRYMLKSRPENNYIMRNMYVILFP